MMKTGNEIKKRSYHNQIAVRKYQKVHYQHRNFFQNPPWPRPTCESPFIFGPRSPGARFSTSPSTGNGVNGLVMPRAFISVLSMTPISASRLLSTTRRTMRANVSSILTSNLALVSMKPQPRLRAHSSPMEAGTCLLSWRSHLFPATIFTGGTVLEPLCVPELAWPGFTPARRARSALSNRVSASMSIRSSKYWSASRESREVMS